MTRPGTIVPALALVMLVLVMGACSRNVATGRLQFNMLSSSQEIALGEEAAPQLTDEFGGAIRASGIQEYMDELGASMVAHTEGDNPDLPWEFTMLNSEVINAFALPGGKVFISRGLAERFTDESQLAAVIGHEIGHVTARHINDRMTRQWGVAALAAAAAAAVGSAPEDSSVRAYGQLGVPALVIGGQVASLSFDRGQELESDRLGVRYMTRAGYDPRGALEVMQVLADASQGGGSLFGAFLSTHPAPSDRIVQMEELLEGPYRGVTGKRNADRYQEKVLAPLASIASAHPLPGEQRLMAAVTMHSSFWCAHCREAALGGHAPDPH